VLARAGAQATWKRSRDDCDLVARLVHRSRDVGWTVEGLIEGRSVRARWDTNAHCVIGDDAVPERAKVIVAMGDTFGGAEWSRREPVLDADGDTHRQQPRLLPHDRSPRVRRRRREPLNATDFTSRSTSSHSAFNSVPYVRRDPWNDHGW
jgi:hypothetical protein